MSNYIKTLLVLIVLISTTIINAGTDGTIRGKVIDSSGQPMAGAQVFIAELNIGAMADENGNYTIDLNGLEAGEYELCFWHEKWDKSMKASGYCGDAYKQAITVTDQDITAGTKIFKRPPKKK